MYSPRSKVSSSSIYRGESQDLSFEPGGWRPVKVVGDEDRQEIIHRVDGLWRAPSGAPAMVKYDGAPVCFYDPRPPKTAIPRRATSSRAPTAPPIPSATSSFSPEILLASASCRASRITASATPGWRASAN